MDESSCSDATLMQRISQLERERDELRLDVEQLCMQQSGMSSKVDIFSQIQARRITGLEQEVEVCKQKLDVCTRRNHKLQDELLEVHHIKAHFADLLKSETDKNLELEKEIKFFQSKVANALVERDRALLQVDKCQEKEKELIGKINQLQDRLELTTSDLLEQKKYCQNLQSNMEAEMEYSKNFQNVVDFFWEIRSKVGDFEHAKGPGDRARVLLQDPENIWVYGDMKKELESVRSQVKEAEAAMAMLQEECHASVALVSSLQRQLEEAIILKQRAEEQCLLLKEKMLHLAVVINAKVRTIHSIMVAYKEDLIATLKEDEKWASSLFESWRSLTFSSGSLIRTKKNSKGIKSQTVACIEDELGGSVELADNREASLTDIFSKDNCTGSIPSPDYDLQIKDIREALALALQEKVATLLLLSQQQERHFLEENMVSAREFRIAELQKQLLQVTTDKGKALIEVANLRKELEKVQEQQCKRKQMTQHSHVTSASNRMLPATWSKGLDYVGSKFSGQDFVGAKVKGGAPSLARLQAENAALWDTLSSLRQLCSTVNRLQQTVVEVAGKPWTEHDGAVSSAVQTIDGVIAKAGHLRVAVSSSLPVSSSGWSISESPTKEMDEIKPHVLGAERREEKDTVPTFGIALLDSILLAAEICRTCLTAHKSFASNSYTIFHL